MKISILTPDLSSNCLGRAWLLAKILQRHYEVEIVGPIFGKGIWRPLAKLNDIPYKPVEIKGRFKAHWQLKRLEEKIKGDVIYAHKPPFASLGIGLLKKWKSRKPLILDIDDWELGFIKESYSNLPFIHRLKTLFYSTLLPCKIGSYWKSLISEKLTRFADEITVSNSFLKEKFGGTIVCHGRDTKAFAPEKFNRNKLRERYGIGKDKKVVMFFGSPRRHKGIEDLIEATSLIPETLLILGGFDESSYCSKLTLFAKERLNERVKIFGLVSFQEVPEFLAMADVIVIPQRKNLASVGQMPAKLFDAMAMAKPIIATSVSDIPEILDGCGWIVNPEDPRGLAKAIQYVFAHPKEAEEAGWKAQEKCVEKYSWNAMEKILVEIFSKYEKRV